MAKVCANHLARYGIGRYAGSQISTKLKVTGIDLFSAGDFTGGDDTEEIVLRDPAGGVYKKLVIKDDKLVGGVLYGDTVDGAWYFKLLREGRSVGRHPRPADVRRVEPGRHRPPGPDRARGAWPTTPKSAAATACARARSSKAIKEKGLFTLDDVRKHTKASSSCGSCTGLVEQILMATAGGDYSATPRSRSRCAAAPTARTRKCATRSAQQHLLSIPAAMAFLEWRTPNGCATCRPALNYYLHLDLAEGSAATIRSRASSTSARTPTSRRTARISVIPRMWGGETTPSELRRIADVVDKYKIPTVKVTGGQRIDLLGVKKEDLPAVWEDLDMPSGHAYAKALRTVKTCVGSEWCRFGTQDSTQMGKELERALWRMYAPHKVKLAVSGCPRNCAESGIKDVGVIGVDSGWEIYVAGNGGIKTEVAQFLVKVKTRGRSARIRRRLPAALSRGRLLPRAHRALRRARRSRPREEARARRCRRPPRAVGAPAVRARRRARSVARDRRRPASTCGSHPDRSRADDAAGHAVRRVRRDDHGRLPTASHVQVRNAGSRSARWRHPAPRRARRARGPATRAATSRCSAPPTTACSRSLDRCPHKGGPLSQGIVFGDRVACPLHNWSHRARTPATRSRPTSAARARFPVRVERRAACTLDPAWTQPWPRRASTCSYCGVGCGVVIEHDGERITGVRGDPDHPANLGAAVQQGPHAAPDRCSPTRSAGARAVPRVRRGTRPALAPATGTPRSTSSPTASPTCIREHGPDSVAFYISGQLLTEDYYVFNKLAKGLVGTNNIDTNSRLCMSSAVAGYKATLGADAPPACYDDIDHADCLFIAGSNTAWAHPVLFRRIEAAQGAQPGAEDHRRRSAPHRDRASSPTCISRSSPAPTSRCSTACCTCMLWEELVDRDLHRRAHDGLRRAEGDRARIHAARRRRRSAASGRTTSSRAARWFAEAGAALSLYCQGLNQSSSGTAKNAALINLHLATGQIGRPGAGPFSLTGQPNAMGGREVGGMAHAAVRRIATSPIPRIARRSRRCGASDRCPRSPGSPRSSCSTRWRRAP